MWPREKILQIADKVSLPKVTEVLPSGCAVCGKDATRLCSHCKAISYCGEHHKNADYNKHGFICKAIEKQRLESSDEAETWLYDSEDEDGRVPEEMVPLTDHILLQRIHSVDSVRAQIKYYDTLNCTWFDPRFEIECGVLPLLARVNQDQKMYDLIKGLFIHKVIGVKVKGADVLECMDFYHDSRSSRERGIVELVLNLALLKAKLLLDMQRIHAAMEVLSQRLPREIVDIVLPGIPQSPTMAIRPTKMSARDVSTEIKNLKGQFNCLYTDVNRLNRHIWLKLASHKLKDSVIEPHQMKGRHSCEMYENQRIFKRQVYAWFETPGAIALIQGKCRSEKKGSRK